jgi:hypothetical protein
MRILDAATVMKILARKGQATQTVVALEFGVGQTMVSDIWLGKSYRSITGLPPHVPTRMRVARTG